MNTLVVYSLFTTFQDAGFSVLRFNFRGVGRSAGEFSGGEIWPTGARRGVGDERDRERVIGIHLEAQPNRRFRCSKVRYQRPHEPAEARCHAAYHGSGAISSASVVPCSRRTTASVLLSLSTCTAPKRLSTISMPSGPFGCFTSRRTAF